MTLAYVNSLTDAAPYANAAALAAVVTTTYSNGTIAEVTGLGAFKLNMNSTLATDNTTVIAATIGKWELFPSTTSGATNYNIVALQATSNTNIIDASRIPWGSVTSAILAPSGTALLPSVAIGTATNGFYAPAANQLGIAVNAANLVTLTATLITVATGAQLVVPASTAAAPAITMGAEQTGIYLAAAGSFGFSVAGAIKANLTATALNMATGVALQVATVQVVTARKTGWTIMTGTPSRATFATGSVTTAQLAGVVMALQQDLGITASGHGLIDA